METITSFFSDNFNSCVWLAVMFVAMIPTLETKIAIPLGMNYAIWGANSLSPIASFVFSFFGSIIPSFFAMFIGRKIKKHTECLLHSKFIQKYLVKSVTLDKQKKINKYLALTLFVAVPVPLTGVWSGSLIAGLSNLKLSYAFLAIALGSLISTSIITLLCTVFNNSLTMLLLITFCFIVIFLFADLILSLIKKKKLS